MKDRRLPSTAGEHLPQMAALGMLRIRQSGWRRFYSLAEDGLCDVLDGIFAMAKKRTSPEIRRTEAPAGKTHARLCDDHIAGRLGCGVAAAMFDAGFVRHHRQGISFSSEGASWRAGLGVEMRQPLATPRCFIGRCSDWIEDAHHIGGAVGATLPGAFRSRDWIRTRRGDPGIPITPTGVTALKRELRLHLTMEP